MVLHKLSLLFLLSLIYVSLVDTARILAIVPTPSYSHQVALWPIWRALSDRGHNITLITTDPDPLSTNITQIDISHTYELFEKNNMINSIEKSNNNIFLMMRIFTDVFYDLEKLIMEDSSVQELIHGDYKFDLVMAESWEAGLFAFAHKFNAPLISVCSIDALFEVHEYFGNPTHIALYSDVMLPIDGNMSFTQRLLSFFLYTITKYYFADLHHRENALINTYFGAYYPTVDELFRRMDMAFLNIDNVFYDIRPLVPATIKIGGALHIKEPIPLPSVRAHLFYLSVYE